MASDTRATVSFHPHTVSDLEWLMAHLKDGQTDVVNKAIRVFAFLEREKENGFEVVLRRQSGEMEVIRWIV